jgi:hypothetical protein
MTCLCSDKKLISLTGKCSDLCSVSYKDQESCGYVPNNIGIGGGDYVEFKYCGNCGYIQNFKPLTDAEIKLALNPSYTEPEYEFDESFGAEQDS